MTGLIAYVLAKAKAIAYTDNKFAAISGGFTYKGSVATVADLPATASKGDEYTVGELGTYVWDGSGWKVAGVKGPKGDPGAKGDKGDPGTHYISASATGTSTDEVNYLTIDENEYKLAGGSEVSVSATGTATDEVGYITIDGVEKKIGDDVFIATVGTTTLSEIQAAYNAGKIILGKQIDTETKYIYLTNAIGTIGTMFQGYAEISSGISQTNGEFIVVASIYWDSTYSTGRFFIDYRYRCVPLKSSIPNVTFGYLTKNTSDSNRLYMGDGTTTNKLAYVSDVVDNATSTDTDKPASARVAKALQDEVNNLKNIGRFLAIWDCSTGLPLSNPETSPYTYKTGDYYRVGTVANGYHHALSLSGTTTALGTYSGSYTLAFTLDSQSVSSQLDTVEAVLPAMGDTTRYSATGTLTTSDATYTITSVIKWVQDSVYYLAICDANEEKLALILASTTQTDTVTGGLTNYKPNGATYTIGVASSTVETEDVEIGWVYYYDGTTWLAQSGGGGGTVQDVQEDGESIVDSGSGVANIAGNVKWDRSQSLTDAQKLQARTNIGATDEEIFIATVGTTTLAEIQVAYAAGKTIFALYSEYNVPKGLTLISPTDNGSSFYGRGILSYGNTSVSYHQVSKTVGYITYIDYSWSSINSTGSMSTYEAGLNSISTTNSSITNNRLGDITYFWSDDHIYMGDGTTTNKLAYYSDIPDLHAGATTLDATLVANKQYILTSQSATFAMVLPTTATYNDSIEVIFPATGAFTPTSSGGTVVGDSLPTTVSGKTYDILFTWVGSGWLVNWLAW